MRLIIIFMLSFFVVAQAFAGVTVEVIKAGDGKTYPKAGQKVTVDYTGTLQNGTKFDSSVDRSQPFSFTLGKGEVIKGWDEGIPQMSLGEEAKLTITPDYAYGTTVKGNIPANSTLIFDVKLLKME